MDATQNKSNLNPFSTFLIIGTAWAFDALDVGLLSFVMPLIRKEWLLTQSQTGLVSSVSSIGMIAGGFLFGHLADKVGRQKTLNDADFGRQFLGRRLACRSLFVICFERTFRLARDVDRDCLLWILRSRNQKTRLRQR